ncbi:hypothetical protein HDU91_000999 [Kappamyces sp. JEL0680]|nr:hypothetical protein HDU91_000999 [Kappamyces sp. JEL0680]
MVVTESNGSKYYGVCITTYSLPTQEQASQIDTLFSDWRNANLADSDYEFAQHVQTQLAEAKETLLKMRHGAAEYTPLLTHAAEEKIDVLEQLLTPLRQSVLMESENIYIPTCLGVLSRWPWYDLLKDWLSLVVLTIQSTEFDRFPFERCVVNLIREVPLPPPGKLEIAIPFGMYKLYCSRPPINTPQVFKNYSCYPLFRTMSIENIVTLFELLATEYKIIFVSEHTSMLSLVCETLCGWMYPFYWHHILIPVLPIRLISYLQAPVPFLVGIQKDSFPHWKEDHWKPSDAAVVDIDNDIIDFPPLKVKLPSRERKKLVQHLEKHSGQTHHAIKRGVPETMKAAFPLGRLQLSTAESCIGARKIQDIPQSMYTTYSNAFLLEKASGIKRGANLSSPSNDHVHHSGNLGSAFGLASSHASVSSAQATSASSTTSASFRVPPPLPPPLKGASDSLAVVDEGVIRESIGSFGNPTPRHSVPRSPYDSSIVSDRSATPDIMVAMHQAIIDGPPESQPAPSSEPSKSAAKIPWWQKMTTSSSFVPAPKDEGLADKPKSPRSFFDKLLGVGDSHQSVASTSPSVQVESPDAESPPKLSINTDSVQQSPNLTHFKEGHIFHELCLAEKEVDIEVDQDDKDQDDEEYADRFTPDSNSSDDLSRSDMSTVTGTQMFSRKSQRVSGQQRSSVKEMFAKKKHSELSPTVTKAQKVKCVDKHECKMCYEELDARKHTIIMCQYCHIQIHSHCLVLTEAAPCALHFNEEKIAHGFFKTFTSLLKHYRTHMKKNVSPTASTESFEESTMEQWFNKPDFLAEFDSESRQFMTVLVDTQAYAQFILDRIERPEDDYEVLYFDESIKQKLNRSRMRFTKEPTPFLDETTYQITRTIEAMAYNTEQLPIDDFHSIDPYEWYPAFCSEPRPFQQLMTAEDQQMMRSHTHEVVQRSRQAVLKGKQDFSKWMKLRWRKSGDVGFSFVSMETQNKTFDDAVDKIGAVIDKYEAAHLSSQTREQLELAIQDLLEQNQLLQKTFDDCELQEGLMRVISIYQEHQAKFHALSPPTSSRSEAPPPLPPRKQTLSPLKSAASMDGDTKIARWVDSVSRDSPFEDTEIGAGRRTVSASDHPRSSAASTKTVSANDVSFIAIPNEDGHVQAISVNRVLFDLIAAQSAISLTFPDPPSGPDCEGTPKQTSPLDAVEPTPRQTTFSESDPAYLRPAPPICTENLEPNSAGTSAKDGAVAIVELSLVPETESQNQGTPSTGL